MASTLPEITLWAKTVVDQQPWIRDPKCLPIPWRLVTPKRTLKIAVLWHDGIVTPTPPVARALKETVAKLRKAGHEVIDWEPNGHDKLLSILSRMFVADGGKSIANLLAPTGEPLRPEMKAYAQSSELGVHTMWQLQLERNGVSKSYLDKWNESGIDAILCTSIFKLGFHVSV